MLTAYTSALVLGFVISIPVGPASLLCMQRTLSRGRTAGLAVGFGIAAADASLAAIMLAGFTIAADFVTAHLPEVLLGSGVLMVGLATRILKRHPETDVEGLGGRDDGALRRWGFFTGFLLTMTNPAAFLMMAAAMTLLGSLDGDSSPPHMAPLIAGIFSGSLLWWSLLAIGISVVQQRLPPAVVIWTNRAAGLALGGLGILTLARALLSFADTG